jgi:ADP-ribose 1''-phosphate phosphatase
MSSKREPASAESGRPLKQSKLSFGGKMAPTAQAAKGSAIDQQKAAKGETPDITEKVPETTTADCTKTEMATTGSSTFVLTEEIGDIFNAPDNTVIIHACNCIGSWGAGIAAAFKQRYPNAFKAYKKHCDDNTPDSLVGTALLIPPMETKGRKHYVGCLFTSRRYGRTRDKPDQILKETTPAMENLLEAMKGYADGEGKIEEIRMCQINSGLFSVPWEKSKALIEEIEVRGDLPKEIIVYSLPNPPKKK